MSREFEKVWSHVALTNEHDHAKARAVALCWWNAALTTAWVKIPNTVPVGEEANSINLKFEGFNAALVAVAEVLSRLKAGSEERTDERG